MTASPVRRSSSPFSRVVHGLVLLGWLLSSNGLAPAFTLLAATLDRCHQLTVENSPHGGVQVVFSHQRDESLKKAHQHSGLTSLMMMLAQQEQRPDSDHILAFSAMEDLGRPSERDVDPEAMSLPAAPLHYVLVKLPAAIWRERIVRIQQAPAWSPGMELKAGMTRLLC